MERENDSKLAADININHSWLLVRDMRRTVSHLVGMFRSRKNLAGNKTARDLLCPSNH
jgi:hypothetical protein